MTVADPSVGELSSGATADRVAIEEIAGLATSADGCPPLLMSGKPQQGKSAGRVPGSAPRSVRSVRWVTTDGAEERLDTAKALTALLAEVPLARGELRLGVRPSHLAPFEYAQHSQPISYRPEPGVPPTLPPLGAGSAVRAPAAKNDRAGSGGRKARSVGRVHRMSHGLGVPEVVAGRSRSLRTRLRRRHHSSMSNTGSRIGRGMAMR